MTNIEPVILDVFDRADENHATRQAALDEQLHQQVRWAIAVDRAVDGYYRKRKAGGWVTFEIPASAKEAA